MFFHLLPCWLHLCWYEAGIPQGSVFGHFFLVCVFQYFACKAHDVSQHLLSSSEVNIDRGSNWAGKQRLYSGAVMCISLACLEMQTHTCLYCGHLSQRRLSRQQATPSLHVGENSWKAHAHTHLLDLDWCDRDGSLSLIGYQREPSVIWFTLCSEMCVRWKRMLCVREKGMRFACLHDSLCNGCSNQNARGN